jgi:RNA polymerase sigma-B factor
VTGARPLADEGVTRELFGRLPSEPRMRDEIVERHRPLAEGLARRFRGRAEQEDLTQVAMLALVKAVDRFDLDRGVPFTAYATATIVGELKRHLRDTAWAVRVPRHLQEVGLAVGRAIEALTQRLGRSPTVSELSAETGLPEEEILEGLEVGAAYEADSLDAPGPGGEGTRMDPAVEDDTLELMEEWTSVAGALRELPERERRILHLRFFRNMSQSAIAAELGISQMHVSRLLARTLARLREASEEP